MRWNTATQKKKSRHWFCKGCVCMCVLRTKDACAVSRFAWISNWSSGPSSYTQSAYLTIPSVDVQFMNVRELLF